MKAHNPSGVPAAVGGYSNAVEVGPGLRTLYISGQVPMTADGVVPTDPEAQCRIIWQHIERCLASAEMTLRDLVKVTTFLSDRSLAPINTAVRQEFLGAHAPALTVVIASIFLPEWVLEIDAIAVAV